MITFTKHELELISKGLMSFINIRAELFGLLDIKESNEKHNEFIKLINKTNDEYNKRR